MPSPRSVNLPESWWIPELDGLRALAALAVVIHHTHGQWFDGIAFANVGVALFYCLSGFLIFVLASREYAQRGVLSLQRFYLRRILRIWPLYFAIIAISLILHGRPGLVPDTRPFEGLTTVEYLAQYGYAFPLFLTNLTAAFNFVGPFQWQAPDFLLVTWSIAVEEQFYAVFPFLFVLIMRPGFPRLRFVTLAIIVSLLGRYAFILLPLNHPHVEQIGYRAGLYYFTLSYIDMFLLGAVAGFAYLKRGSHGVESPRTMRLLFVGSAVASVGLMFLWEPSLWPPYTWYSPIIYTLVAVVLSCLIYAVVSNPSSGYARILRAYPLRVLGFLSYGMYLVHFSAIRFARWHLAAVAPAFELPEPVQTVLLMIYLFTFVFAVTVVLYVTIERPFLMLKRRPPPEPARLSSTSVPWQRCLLFALSVLVVFELCYWRPVG